MILKYYAEVPLVKEGVEFYTSIFPATVIKDGSDGHHGNIKLFGQISLLMSKERVHREKPGYHIIKFDDSEHELYKTAVAKIRKAQGVRIQFDDYQGRWGTTLFEFTDKFGYTWDLEINTSALK